MIEVKNLVKDYYGNVAVDGLSFTVEEGEIVGFLGPNGAGKSTTMNIITGYLSATEGQVIVNGYDVFEDPEKAKKSIGYLPEQPPLYPDMKVREYLMFVADLKKVKKSERASMIKSIMELTKITDVSEKLIKFLSKGYKQRVGLAAAIVGYPEILILDEPTVGLDPKQIIEIRELIKSLSKKHTILLSSHIMQEIDAVCDKIIIINKGKLIAYDTPANIARVMENSRELHITVCGSEMTVRRALDYVDGIKKLDVRYSDATGMSDITIKMNEGCDVRKNVSEKLMDAKCPIIEMKLHEVSIEEIFLKLTNSNNKEDK
ncbi:MAG: ABC transporter ATP-binding protein [Lachnospiraceae bacterium]|nr:ABC transporter ATP-binding protein [Lachnoclostridium sp.]MDD7521962.1 ABC transporter ATP-binding protein [Lachnoclostridium sp.]MDY2599461.1 ABC transporter ATP-binding protein [Lachnospiraceae bacterium]